MTRAELLKRVGAMLTTISAIEWELRRLEGANFDEDYKLDRVPDLPVSLDRVERALLAAAEQADRLSEL